MKLKTQYEIPDICITCSFLESNDSTRTVPLDGAAGYFYKQCWRTTPSNARAKYSMLWVFSPAMDIRPFAVK